MKSFPFQSIVACLVLVPITFFSCSSSDDGESGGEKKHVSSISGVAQKGQFLKGSSITIYALDKNLSATGLSYPTQTTDDMGSFTVSNVDADFIDVKANGYYYNENKGRTSESTINLQALAASSNKVNVNLLTTLAYNRIKHLVGTGLSFSDAQNRAQIEVLTALGLGNSTSMNFTDMNIAGSGDANGLLLAASLLIQQNRSVGNVSKLISDIAADIEEDGTLSNDLNQEIHRYEADIYVGDVIRELINFYEENKVENFSIPTFYYFLDTDGDGKMDGKADNIFKNISYAEINSLDPMDMNPGYSAAGFSITQTFLSTIPFNVESDATWLSVEKKMIAENIYAVNIVAQPNTGENRTAHITYSDNSGKELQKYTYQQQAPEGMVPQRLFFQAPNIYVNHIGVNGKTYNAGEITYSYTTYWYVDIPSSEKQDKYQTYFPTNMVSMPDGYGTFKLTIPASITSDEFPFISQRDGIYAPITNPAQTLIRSACPSIMIDDHGTTSSDISLASNRLSYTSRSSSTNSESIDHIVLISNQPICGSAKYVINNGDVDIRNPQIIEQETHADENGQYKFTVQIIHHENVQTLHIPILTFASVHVQCYNTANQLIQEFDTSSQYYNFSGGMTR